MQLSKKNLKDIYLYVVLFLILCVLFYKKTDFHIDELLTYNLSNAERWFSPEDGVTYYPAETPFVDAMSSNGIFDLSHVWKQQANDTHPPFYYILVHAICTIFPGEFSIRYAGIINIVFQLFIFWVFRQLLALLIENKKINCVLSVMYILNAGVLSITTFLRMYTMTMFWVILIAYLVLRNIERYSVRDFMFFSLITICGTLTHYYFIVYVFFLSITLVLSLLRSRRFKEIICYVSCMGIAGSVSIMIFPAMLRHIFKGGRGAESLENLGSSDLIEQFTIYYEIVNNNLFGGFLGVIISVIFFVLLLDFFRTDNNEEILCKFDTVEKQRYMCLICPAIFYTMLISKTAPYNTDRYISPIYAIIIIGIMSLLYKCIVSVINKEKSVIGIYSIIIAIIIAVNFANCSWGYLQQDSKERLNNAEIYGGRSTDAICFHNDSNWMIMSYFLEISKCNSVTLYKSTDY